MPGYLAPPPPTKRGLSSGAVVGIAAAAVVVVLALVYFAFSSGRDKAFEAAAKGDWNCTDVGDDGDNNTFVLMIRDDVFAVRYHNDYYDEDGVFGGTWSLENGRLSVALQDETYGVDNVPGSMSGHLGGFINEAFGDGGSRDVASFSADLSAGRVQFSTDRDTITCTKQG